MKKRIDYLDLLRVLAILAVITIHVVAINWDTISTKSFLWQTNNIFNALSRWCIPVFAGVSGAIFLNNKKNIEIKDIWTKYIPKMVLLIFIWGIIYNIYVQQTISFSFVIDTIKLLLKGQIYSHLWYLYMMIGFYIMLPFLKMIVKGASKKELEYFILICTVVTVILPTVLAIDRFSSFSGILSKTYISFFGGFTLYFMLGYYLSTYEIKVNYQKIVYTLTALVAIITVFISNYKSYTLGIPYYNIMGQKSPLALLMGISIFLVAKKFINKISDNNSKLISNVGKNVLGIYLVHEIVINELNGLGINNSMFNPVISVPIVVILVFIISYFIVYLLDLIPGVKKIVN